MPVTVHHVDTPAALAEAAARLRDQPVIGVDTESDSMHCYFEKVCFIQVAAGDDAWIIDTIRLRELGPLQDVFESPDGLKVLHGADYDVLCLSRDFDVRFGRIFDTMLASQFLGRESLGLAALCREHFDVELDKSMTRHNWALRPLDPRYVDYLVDDVIYLGRLHAILAADVDAAGLRDELELELERLRHLRWSAKSFDEEDWRRIKGARAVDREGQPALKALWLLRDKLARDRDLPPFKIMNNQTLIELAMARPRTVQQLGNGRFAQRYGRQVIGALEAARCGDVAVARPPRRDEESVQRALLGDALRKWRSAKAQEIQRPSIVVLPKHVMEEIVERRPTTLEELAHIPWIGPHRIDRWGEELLDVVAAASEQKR